MTKPARNSLKENSGARGGHEYMFVVTNIFSPSLKNLIKIQDSFVTRTVYLFDKFGLSSKFITKNFSRPDASKAVCLLRVHKKKPSFDSYLFVDPTGLEPATSSLQMRRSSQMS